MHKEILTKEQIDLLFLVDRFSKNFSLVGGTAIALNIGHRHSIDFDLFSLKEFRNINLRKRISEVVSIEKIIRDEEGQYTFIIKGVQFTFFHYPFPINFSDNFDDIIKMPNLVTLAAMKAFALGRRAKWKDYVDLYFIMKNYHSIDEIIKKAEEIFKQEFNEKIFREQLSYFEDVNYSEEIIYLPSFEVKDDVVKKELVEFSLS